MRNKTVLIAFVCCSLIALYFIITGSRGKPAGNTAAHEVQGSRVSQKGDAVPLQGQVDPGAGTERFPKFHSEQFTEFLRERPSDPHVAAAVFDLTNDMDFLKECLQKWPDSPDLLSQMALREMDPQAKLGYAQRLIEVSPDASTGYYAKAVALLLAGNSALAQSALDLALSKGPPAMDGARLPGLRRQALEAIGLSTDQARISSLVYPGEPAALLHMSLRRILADINSGTGAGVAIGPERATAMAEHLLQVPAPTIINRNSALLLQEQLLHHIDPDTLFGDTGRTVGEHLLVVQSELNEITELRKESMTLESRLSEHEYAQFVDDVMAVGWKKALEALKSATK